MPKPRGIAAEAGPYFTPKLRVVPYHGNIYLLEPDALYRSTDEGRTWNSLSVPDVPRLTGLQIDSSGTLLLSVGPLKRSDSFDDSWVYVSRDQGETWGPAEHPLVSSEYDRFIVGADGSYIYIVTFGGVFRSTDQGATWEQSEHDLDGLIQFVELSLGKFPNGDLVAATVEADDGTLYELYSNDNGKSWTKREFIWNYDYFIPTDSVFFAMPRSVSASSTQRELCRRTGQGEPCSDMRFFRYQLTPMNMTMSKDGTLYLERRTKIDMNWPQSSYVHELYRSTDVGLTWSSTPMPRFRSEGILAIGSRLLAFGEGGPYASEDGGHTWMLSNEGIPPGGYDGYRITPIIGGWVAAAANLPIHQYRQYDGRQWTFISHLNLPQHETGTSVVQTADQSIYIADGTNLLRRQPGGVEFALMPRTGTVFDQDGTPVESKSVPIRSMGTISGNGHDLLLLGLENGALETYSTITQTWQTVNVPSSGPEAKAITHISSTAGRNVFIVREGENIVYRARHSELLEYPDSRYIWRPMDDIPETDAITSLQGIRSGRLLLRAGDRLYTGNDDLDGWTEVVPPVSEGEFTINSALLTRDAGIFASITYTLDSTRNRLITMPIDGTSWNTASFETFGNTRIRQLARGRDGESMYAVLEDGRALRAVTLSGLQDVRRSNSHVPSLTAFPNPAGDVVTLRSEMLQPGTYPVRMVDMAGNEVLRSRPVEFIGPSGRGMIDVSGLPSGLYRCELLDPGAGSSVSVPITIIR